ncbi:unnamed protein product, partial [Laminaria digitata]
MAVQQHADIIAVSYEARRLGVTKHMPPRTIRQQYPSVKLVHVETIGLDNSKVTYRNYRKAARAIFTLVRGFCPPEDGGSSFRGGAGGAGTFQKTSVDEAYLEPTRRTLAAELYKSNDKERRTPAAQLILSGDDKERTGKRTLLCSPALAKRAVLRGLSAPAEKAAERGRSDKEHTDNRTVMCSPALAKRTMLCSPPAKKTAVDASSGCALICGFRDFGDEEMKASEGGDSLGGGGGGGENAMGVAVAVDGFPDDG